MSNKGQKALAGQVQHLRQQNAQQNARNTRLNNEIRLLQSVQFSMLEPNFFRALWKWFRKWRNFRKEIVMVEYDGRKFPKGSRITSKENGELIIAPAGTPDNEIVVTL